MTTAPGLRATGGPGATDANALRRLPWRLVRFSRRQPLGAFSAVVLVVLVLSAALADLVVPYDPIRNNVGPSLEGPSGSHFFGTDHFGRDVFSRIVHGARTSLYVGIGANVLGVLSATLLGAISGYLGGKFDYIAQRFVDVAHSIPPLIFLLGVLLILGPRTEYVILALGLRTGLSLSRIVRGSVIDIKGEDFVEAARSFGASDARILTFHVLPNIFALIIVLVSTTIGGLIVAEAALSFLGFGVPPPTPSWGGMLSVDGRIYMLAAPWLLIAPAFALTLVVFATNMFGDALRDELDPRLRSA
ncbi:MAG: ABC transporter permease [Dehalococcoidia bacterium]|nr:ABC transporter permease [Dehalococcoidia bacterium]MXZ88497.1 ABC transporter permease [Dehalococcoidia bacterium]MYH67308.1 ABC transporter permease [Dehalococcoidia bacterium]MYI86064.1 ABC transporter permease [Dehalococcoidia bacterium]